MKERQNSLLILHFWNKNVKHVFVDHGQNISADKSKQTSTFLEIQNLNESSFKHLLTYLSLSINRHLEIWRRLLTFYFRSLKGSQKIFLGSSLGPMLDFLYWFAKSQLSGFFSFLSLKLSSVTKLGNYLASALSRSLPLALHNEALLKCKIYNSKFTTGTRFLPHFVKWRVPLPC